MARYISRLYIVVDAECEGEAADAMVACLSENLKYDDHIVEWAYSYDGERWGHPRLLPDEWQAADLDPEDVSNAPSLDLIWQASNT